MTRPAAARERHDGGQCRMQRLAASSGFHAGRQCGRPGTQSEGDDATINGDECVGGHHAPRTGKLPRRCQQGCACGRVIGQQRQQIVSRNVRRSTRRSRKQPMSVSVIKTRDRTPCALSRMTGPSRSGSRRLARCAPPPAKRSPSRVYHRLAGPTFWAKPQHRRLEL